MHADLYDKHAALKAFAMKPWPYYRRMQAFMPGTQPQGTHAFDPGNSSCASATQVLDKVNAEDDGEEDQAGPSLDTPAANVPAAFTSAISSLLPHDFDTASVGTFQSDVMPPPPSSTISPTIHSDRLPHSQQHHISINSAPSCTTSSETSSSHRKRKRDATGEMLPSSSKRGSRSKTDTLNPVIISSQLNSTLTRLADVMEKSLDVTATSIEPPTTQPVPSSSPQASSMISQFPGPRSTLSSTSSSDSEVLDKAIGIITADKDFLSEDNLLAASLFFSNTSNELVRVARTFIALSNRPAMQHRFLLRQLEDAGLRAGKGKGKANTNIDDDDSMSY